MAQMSTEDIEQDLKEAYAAGWWGDRWPPAGDYLVSYWLKNPDQGVVELRQQLAIALLPEANENPKSEAIGRGLRALLYVLSASQDKSIDEVLKTWERNDH